MKYKTPKIGERFSLKIIGGKVVTGFVTASVDRVGFELNGRIYLDSCLGETWKPAQIQLENK